ncbi:MAG: hypothetical protein H0U62_07135 [Actinobacteria bacterium]|nr:hypothetical protein [Actinomycetota bacterium]
MHKTTLATLSAVALLPGLAVTAYAAPPRMYHSINVENASMSFVRTEGCLQAEVFIAGSHGHWAGRGGPAVKQEGPSSVFLRVSDICAAEGEDGPNGRFAAAAGGGGNTVYTAEGQAMIGLDTDARLTHASLAGDFPGEDGEGNPVVISVYAEWEGTGGLSHETSHSNVQLPPLGNVNSADNLWHRDATGIGSVSVAEYQVSGEDPDAVIQRVKAHCIEIPTGPEDPAEEFYPCFGFHG